MIPRALLEPNVYQELQMPPKKRKRPARHIYVVRLKRSVFEVPRFQARNQACDPTKQPLYVGLTGKDPAERLAEHKRGYKAASIVRKYGKTLLLGKGRNTYKDHKRALEIERQIAAELRALGHAVWQG